MLKKTNSQNKKEQRERQKNSSCPIHEKVITITRKTTPYSNKKKTKPQNFIKKEIPPNKKINR
jgi:hypothetical protein